MMGRKRSFVSVLAGMAGLCLAPMAANAVVTLQVGAPGGPGEGTYADYTAALTAPIESDTAVTSGNEIYVAGAYKAGANKELLVGSQYTADGTESSDINAGDTGQNWSDFGYDAVFNNYGAILMATIPDGSLAGAILEIDGASPFYTTDTYEDGFLVPAPPSNHAPIPNQDYMFFHVGDFDMSNVAMPDFADESTSNQTGQIKSVFITDVSNLDWIHFDLFALVTTLDTTNGRIKTDILSSSTDGNPGSHDLTWKDPGPGPGPGPSPAPGTSPEPITGALGMMGLMVLSHKLRRRR